MGWRSSTRRGRGQQFCVSWVAKGGTRDVPAILPDVPKPWGCSKSLCKKPVPVSPYPLNLGGEDSPPKFRGRPSKNTVKEGASDTPPPFFFFWGVNLHLLNLRGLGLQGCSCFGP